MYNATKLKNGYDRKTVCSTGYEFSITQNINKKNYLKKKSNFKFLSMTHFFFSFCFRVFVIIIVSFYFRCFSHFSLLYDSKTNWCHVSCTIHIFFVYIYISFRECILESLHSCIHIIVKPNDNKKYHFLYIYIFTYL